jgi:type IV secretion system protein VirB4
MMPLSAMWAGPDRNDHLDAPPLLFAKSKGATPFRLVPHVGDVGHTLVVGPTGSGKSVLLAMMALQFRRYPNAQIFAFDFGGSIRAATLGMGGEWYDLGGSLSGDAIEPVALQPLAAIDNLGERAWAAAWVATIIARQGVAVTPEVRERLWVALGSLADSPRVHRTLTGLSNLIQSNEIRQALQPYCLGGPWGLLLDAEAEQIGDASVQAFEIEGLIGTDAAPAVLACLFHRIERRLDGSPTLLIIDEAWRALDDPSFGAQVREWLKTWRKKNGSVWFATHSLADIENSPIAAAIIESCPSRIFLPNDRATEPQITRIYERFGLNARQIQHIATATPKRDYYYASQRGNRAFDLGLERDSITLAFTAASSKQDQTAITDLMIREGRDEFARAWMRYKSIEWAIEFYDTAVAARATSAPKGAIPGKAALEGAER